MAAAAAGRVRTAALSGSLRLLLLAWVLLGSASCRNYVPGNSRTLKSSSENNDSIVPSDLVVYSKIIGGEPADPDAYPFIASLRIPQGLSDRKGTDLGGRHYCGASLISKNAVLTAAHCVNATLLRNPDVYFGLVGRNNTEGPHFESFKVARTLVHPEFERNKDGSYDRDAAILFLDGEPKAEHISWKTDEECFESKKCGSGTVLGWGLTEEGNLESSSEALLAVKVPFISRKKCRGLMGSDAITDAMVCAGSKGKDACQNDSGGPLLIGSAIGGIVSWGLGCGRENGAGVYTSLSFLDAWLREHLHGGEAMSEDAMAAATPSTSPDCVFTSGRWFPAGCNRD